jgi:hypothetical protein
MTTRNRALCCECGNLRTVSSNFWFPHADPNKTFDDGYDSRGWRMTGTLKCAVCKQKTRHARLRDDVDPEHRDRAESRMTGCPVCGAPDGMPCMDIMGIPFGRPCVERMAER